MNTQNTPEATGLPLRSNGILAYSLGYGCRLRFQGRGGAAELIAIGQEWARVREAPGQAGPGAGDFVELELGLSGGSDLPASIPGFVIDRMGGELWLRFVAPLAVAQHEMQSSLDHRAAA